MCQQLGAGIVTGSFQVEQRGARWDEPAGQGAAAAGTGAKGMEATRIDVRDRIAAVSKRQKFTRCLSRR